ncbi:MAG: hypothetical protein H6710_13680 [Myxococcales bacterium]|nr:hypothetical protein [Myxococcales bacterium]
MRALIRMVSIPLALAAALTGGCRRGAEETTPPPVVEESGRQLHHPAAPITLRLPEGWESSEEAGTLTLVSPGEEVVMMLLAVEAGDLEESLAALNRELGAIVPNATVEEISEVKINGLEAMVADGAGTLDGQAVSLGLVLLRAPNGRILMIVGLARADASPASAEGTASILASLQAAE